MLKELRGPNRDPRGSRSGPGPISSKKYDQEVLLDSGLIQPLKLLMVLLFCFKRSRMDHYGCAWIIGH